MHAAGVVLLALLAGVGWTVDAETDQAAIAALRAAAEAGDATEVKSRAAGLEPEILDPIAQRATCLGRLEAVRALVAAGARPVAFGAPGLTCLLALPENPYARAPSADDHARWTELARVLLGAGVAPGPLLEPAARACATPVAVLLVERILARGDGGLKSAVVASLRCADGLPEMLLARAPAMKLDAPERRDAIRLLVAARPPPDLFRRRLATLIEMGGDVNGADSTGTTALRAAVTDERGASLDVLRALLAAGADPRLASTLHGAASSVGADQCGSVFTGSYKRRGGVPADRREAVRKDLEARCAEHQEALEALLAKGADPTPRDGWRSSPTVAAAYEGDVGAVRRFASRGAHPNARDCGGDTALLAVAGNTNRNGGEFTAIRALLAAGADPQLRDASGRTAYDILRARGLLERLGHLLPPGGRTLAAVGARASASSVLVEKGKSPERYIPAKAIDGTTRTCWCKGVKGHGIGEWLQLEFPAPVRIRAVRVYPGCGADDKVYFSNNRITALDVLAGAVATKAWLDDYDRRFYDLGVETKEPVASLLLTIVAIQHEPDESVDESPPKYDDTCIGEVEADLE